MPDLGDTRLLIETHALPVNRRQIASYNAFSDMLEQQWTLWNIRAEEIINNEKLRNRSVIV